MGAAIEQEENKVLRAQLELGQVRQEIDRRIQEKEEEFDNTRKNHQRAMESLGASLEGEQRAKGEALRIKKKLESDINELEIALDHANKANAEGQKAIKRYQGQLRETIQGFEDQARGRQEVMEAVGIAERKAGALSGEVEESRALLDSADRGKRQIDAELADARNAVNEMQIINFKAMHDKRGLESVIHTFKLKLMILCNKPRILRRNPRGQWSMPPDLLMSCVLNKIMSKLSLVPRGHLTHNLVSLKSV